MGKRTSPLRAVAVVCALGAQGCAAAQAGIDEPCRPTGWVDRIEEGFAVVTREDADEVLVVPVECFPEPVQEGTRVVRGRIDWAETERNREEIRRLLERLQEKR